MILISVHVPKTGGTSFRKILQSLYGDGFREDYPWTENRPIWMIQGFDDLSQAEIRDSLRDIRCIHGHFPARKYAPLQSVEGLGIQLVTWLRDPIERAVSTYLFLRSLNTPADQQPDWERKAKTLDMLEYFQSTPYGSNRQAAQLRDVDLSRFSFIGIMERYEETIRLFLTQFMPKSSTVTIPHELKNESRVGKRYQIEDEVRQVLLEKNVHDFRLYQAGCELFDRRIKKI
jgi:hypothetical protein